MLQIAQMIKKAKAEGYDEANAEAKVCQDIILSSKVIIRGKPGNAFDKAAVLAVLNQNDKQTSLTIEPRVKAEDMQITTFSLDRNLLHSLQ